MARRGTSETALETWQPTQEPVPELSVPRGLEVVQSELATQTARNMATSVATLIAEGGFLERDKVPGFLDITHPHFYTETFRPTQNPYIGDGSRYAREGITGRVLDIDINKERKETGASQKISEQMTLLDEAFMPGHIGMQAEAKAAEQAGNFSPYWPLIWKPVPLHDEKGKVTGHSSPIRSDRDVYFVWTLNSEGQRFNSPATGKLGEWVLRGILSGNEAHNEDAYLLQGIPQDNGDISYREAFLDYLSYGENKHWFEGANRSLRNPQSAKGMRVLRSFVDAMSGYLLNPEYDHREKSAHVDKEAYEIIESTLGRVRTAEYPLSTPSNVFIRAAKLLEELDHYHPRYGKALTREGRNALNAQRVRILQSIVAAEHYMRYIGRAGSDYRNLAHKRQDLNEQGYDVNTNIGFPIRLEIVGLDDIDRMTVRAAKRVLDAKRRGDSQPYETKLLKTLITHLTNGASGEDKVIIRATGDKTLLPFHNLSPEDGPGRATSHITYDGVGIPHIAYGHYAHEIVESVVNPYTHNGRFPQTGLAMGGVVAAFELQTPEQEHESGAPENTRVLITSAKLGPWAVSKYLLDIYHDNERSGDNLVEMLKGQIGLTNLLATPREQRWRMAAFRRDEIDVSPVTFRNGDAFALVSRPDGSLDTFKGAVSGEKPRKRGLGQYRGQTSHRYGQPVYRDANNRTGSLVANGNGAQLQIAFADGAIHVQDTLDPRVEAYVIPHFIDVRRKGKK